MLQLKCEADVKTMTSATSDVHWHLKKETTVQFLAVGLTSKLRRLPTTPLSVRPVRDPGPWTCGALRSGPSWGDR